jgi:hypothetical protein
VVSCRRTATQVTPPPRDSLTQWSDSPRAEHGDTADRMDAAATARPVVFSRGTFPLFRKGFIFYFGKSFFRTFELYFKDYACPPGVRRWGCRRPSSGFFGLPVYNTCMDGIYPSAWNKFASSVFTTGRASRGLGGKVLLFLYFKSLQFYGDDDDGGDVVGALALAPGRVFGGGAIAQPYRASSSLS